MQPVAHDAAMALRRSIIREGTTPASFRARLADVPARDRDAWLDLLWDSGDIPEDDPRLPRGCVPYLPCPVETVVDALLHAAVTPDDVFVDVGSGLGRAAVLAHLFTGAGCIGLEIQPDLVQAARERAARLNLDRVGFIEGDAADLIGHVTVGTVFFLYCPFGGERLDRVLDELERIAQLRPIRICGVGLARLDRPWLTPVPSTPVDLDVYRSTGHER